MFTCCSKHNVMNLALGLIGWYALAHIGSTTTLKKNGWFFKEIVLASLALKFKLFLSLVEGAFVCGMWRKINEMDSPLGDKGACERRPKSIKEGPNGGWDIETIGDEEGIISRQSPYELEFVKLDSPKKIVVRRSIQFNKNQ